MAITKSTTVEIKGAHAGGKVTTTRGQRPEVRVWIDRDASGVCNQFELRSIIDTLEEVHREAFGPRILEHQHGHARAIEDFRGIAE